MLPPMMRRLSCKVLVLDVVVAEQATILKLAACKGEPLLGLTQELEPRNGLDASLQDSHRQALDRVQEAAATRQGGNDYLHSPHVANMQDELLLLKLHVLGNDAIEQLGAVQHQLLSRGWDVELVLDLGLHVVDGVRGAGHDDDLLQGVEVADHEPHKAEATRLRVEDLR
jgi:hypothetical protein